MTVSEEIASRPRAPEQRTHVQAFFAAAARICAEISFSSIDARAFEFDRLRARKGRLFLLGVGGSAANCGHAVNDFRKLCGIATCSPVDNVSELTQMEPGWVTFPLPARERKNFPIDF